MIMNAASAAVVCEKIKKLTDFMGVRLMVVVEKEAGYISHSLNIFERPKMLFVILC